MSCIITTDAIIALVELVMISAGFLLMHTAGMNIKRNFSRKREAMLKQ